MKKRVFLVLSAVAFSIAAFFYHQYDSPQQVSTDSNSSSQSQPADPLPADWVKVHQSSAELINDSEIIVRGHVTASSPELRHDVVFTMQTIEITQFYGISTIGKKVMHSLDKENPTIELLQTGGVFDSIATAPFAEAALLAENKEYIFFLHSTEEGHYLPSGSFQGIAEIKNQSLRFSKESAPIFPELENQSVTALLDTISGLPEVSSTFQFNFQHESPVEFLAHLD
ncbi:hypothetical protein [Candidatus Enterococcus leclercqii]|uniref:hypothetical protein n=1 Tax=Candidatus Enterococcus leclercqii TaxID=1857218 RepID=UPI0013794390|nr:hypothetical protein [Enterococcus sp. CU9D]KAF1290786.1 hypothetical protein BAU14_08400 [Enterococcus sp. CU9D]